ncbi:MAG: hypothetical protein ACK4PC_03070 [Sphingopyxis sp.]|uniref:hypothetical protein n=1 Tax=Sphingopyxis terrae TaxID=33052 RepID=UPI0020C55252|nr:hypothetical protein [Sphingopyxis terrae]
MGRLSADRHERRAEQTVKADCRRIAEIPGIADIWGERWRVLFRLQIEKRELGCARFGKPESGKQREQVEDGAKSVWHD